MRCPECNADKFYLSFNGKGECVDEDCKLFSKRHAKAEGVSCKEPKIPVPIIYGADGWSEYIGGKDETQLELETINFWETDIPVD